MASEILSIKCQIDTDKFDIFTHDMRQAVADGIYDTVVQAKDTVAAYTPYDPKHAHGGPHLNEPSIYRYENGTVSLQWRANNKGFYYAQIQNSDYTLNHPHGGRAGFADDAKQIIEENTPTKISSSLRSRGW